ncbi:toll/interleukin-1 receptor domain-containing protein [Morganella psychrotolerans]|uniref:toll/interleukin-1 receptor domain-containing protein n=1 Tax=Morganella psychrotolerans TaxID=368603 RepID=UPI0039AF831E
MSLNVFISYSHKDEEFKETLDEHLSILKRQGLITTWNDRDIVAGTEWEEEISTKLETADIIILLVSSSFIASNYCYSKEVNLAIERHDRKDTLVIPIIVRRCHWDTTPFHKIQSVPTDGRPIASWENVDDGWYNAITGIKEAINKLHREKDAEKKKNNM